MKCRHCNSDLVHKLIDLGVTAPSNAYLTSNMLNMHERKYPLKVLVCDKCWLVQTEDFVGADEMFSPDYAYFSSFSSTWLDHAKRYVDMIAKKASLSSSSCVVEIAANDGYLLQYVQQKDIPCYGIDPTHNTAAIARKKGIEIIEDFFDIQIASDLSKQNKHADLMIANNVLAHVPDINGFVKGFSILLKPNGIATFEFPHLLNLIEKNQFDTIYHEHYSYLSITSVKTIFNACGLEIFDVEELRTHGGSIRIYAQKIDTGTFPIEDRVQDMLDKEREAGMTSISFYKDFQDKADKIKHNLILFLKDAHNKNLKVAGYGAAAKGNTLINFSGVKSDLIHCIADKNTSKQGKFMPDSHIPIVDEDALKKYKPDYVLILPWNIKEEIIDQLTYVRDWGAKFVTIVPEIEIK